MEYAKEQNNQLVKSFKDVEAVASASLNFTRLFGTEVKIRRTAVGLRQDELAEIAQSYGTQVSQSYISRLEGGQRSDPGIALVVVLAAILDISLDHIILLAQGDLHAIANE